MSTPPTLVGGGPSAVMLFERLDGNGVKCLWLGDIADGEGGSKSTPKLSSTAIGESYGMCQGGQGGWRMTHTFSKPRRPDGLGTFSILPAPS